MRITTAEARKIGVRAAAWVSQRASNTTDHRGLLVPDLDGIPDGVHRTLCRVYGTPATVDRGETAYWLIDGRAVEAIVE